MDAANQVDTVIWMDGTFVPFQDASIHPLSISVQYGMGVFEGIRVYAAGSTGMIFRLKDHTRRLFESAHILDIKIPYSQDEVNQAIVDTVRQNKMISGYVRPMVSLGAEYFGLHAQNLSVHLMIAALRMGEYLITANADAGLRLRTSSYARIHPSTLMCKAKACGHYLNSILAYREARYSGHDDAIMLDSQGGIAEASSSNVFIVKNDVVYTPPEFAILLGITRDSVMHICKGLNLPLVVKSITRDEAYTADEMFVSGTAAEIKAVGEYDNRKIGTGLRGPVTKKIQEEFKHIVSGQNTNYSAWLSGVY